ncbi:VOC family protein [Aureimonas sp. AU12]|uniref:VOC family protein n=1 Tax=Aureimonas sp. AU12 TaxID=1638161 RepID=UPI000780BDDE|nr:VOC family protein [Aureimonas sp. AU12]
MVVLALDHLQLAILPAGEAEARRFYGERLGMAEIAKPESLVGRGGCWFAVGDIQLHCGVEQDFRPALKAHPAFLVDDLAALEDRLAAAGHPVEPGLPLPGYDRLYTADPFGNRIELMQRRPD